MNLINNSIYIKVIDDTMILKDYTSSHISWKYNSYTDQLAQLYVVICLSFYLTNNLILPRGI